MDTEKDMKEILKEIINCMLDILDEERLEKVREFTRGLLKPNKETLEAFAEAEEMKRHPERYKRYSSVEELFADLESDGEE
ncbi:MAG: hypothetical protein NC253_15905 [Ruminococcus sp.]|nr:hypothetical protein [Ruminococcus sp.]MCM1382110.1 hypothetical protein [Muribaculaceae bacterium]MCM1478531.1 hypothetical protein [Muribaculaceae bacterium]